MSRSTCPDRPVRREVPLRHVTRHTARAIGLKVGYARVSTTNQDLTAQRDGEATSVHDPNDPVGRLLLNVLATVAEIESDLIRTRTCAGLAVARAEGKLRGRKPKLTTAWEALLIDLDRTGQKSPSNLAELFGVGRPTVCRALERAADTATASRRRSSAGHRAM